MYECVRAGPGLVSQRTLNLESFCETTQLLDRVVKSSVTCPLQVWSRFTGSGHRTNITTGRTDMRISIIKLGRS